VEEVRSKKPWSGRSKLTAVQPSRYPCAHIYSGIWLFGPPWGSEGGENIGKSSYYNLPPHIGFILFTPIKGRIDSLTVYIYKVEGPVEQVRSKKPWSGRSKLAAVQPLWLNFRPLPVSRIA
jgi:hypothetical protein